MWAWAVMTNAMFTSARAAAAAARVHLDAFEQVAGRNNDAVMIKPCQCGRVVSEKSYRRSP